MAKYTRSLQLAIPVKRSASSADRSRPQPREPGRRPSGSGSGAGRRRPAERAGREPAGPWPANPSPVGCHVFPVPVEPPPAPRRVRRAALPCEHTAPAAGLALRGPDAPARRPRARARTASARKTQTSPALTPRRAARDGGNGLQTTAVRRPGTARTGGNGAPGTSRVHDSYKKGPRQVHRISRNSRVSLPLWHLIPEQKVKKTPQTRFL